MKGTGKIGRLAAIAAVSLVIGCGGDGDAPPGPTCATSSVAPPDVSGTWVLSSLQLGATSCPAQINQILEDVISTGPDVCEVEVTQAENTVTLVDCDDVTTTGCVDSDGIIRASDSTSATEQGCTVSIHQTFVADSSSNQSTADFQMQIAISGNCTVTGTCNAVIEADWDRVVTRARGTADPASPSLHQIAGALASGL